MLRPLPRLLLLLCLPLLLALPGTGPLPRRPWSVPPPQDPPAARLGPRQLAVVINAADPLSERIGSYYQRRRGIPADQVIRVRFPPGRAVLSPAAFRRLHRQVLQQTPERVQAYALAWIQPWRVGCQSITAAFASGYDPRTCVRGCRAIPRSPLYGRLALHDPHARLGMRPAMLLAARDMDQARALIERGIAADGSAPAGTAYLFATRDRARNVRAAGYPWARRWLGGRLRIVVVPGDALRGADDVMFYFTGLPRVPDIGSNRFLPGAVADHLTSAGGELLGGAQMSALAWLEAGATGSYGAVVEPCNLPGKFPDPGVLMAAYLNGDTLIEAYWKSVAMPGQGVFLGEPLARPWGRGGRAAAAQPRSNTISREK